MANSDNVIRAGLTPKLRDIPNLIAGLTYEPAEGSQHQVQPTPYASSDNVSTLYDPPVPEFAVVQVLLPSNGKTVHPAVGGPSLAIVTSGSGQVAWGKDGQAEAVSTGDVVFIGADTETQLSTSDGLTLYRAFVE
jgi:mannose-6-phosphate isomerase